MDSHVYEAEQRSRTLSAERHVRLLDRMADGGRLLDVGCASGLFLQCAQRSNWDVMGVEPNEVLAAKAAQRLGQERVRNTTLQEADLPLASFNAITLWDVLEHVVSPPDFLRLCAGLLKPRGVVIAKVPDLDSWHARLMGNKWPLFLPEHLGYFTKRSVTVSADKAGLRVVCFGRSAVTFSLGYILLRAGQHGVPMAQACHRAIGDGFLGTLPISIRLGELYVTLTASPSHQRTGDSQ